MNTDTMTADEMQAMLHLMGWEYLGEDGWRNPSRRLFAIYDLDENPGVWVSEPLNAAAHYPVHSMYLLGEDELARALEYLVTL